ncbi:hypothetical protein HYALB_00013975 [Hymenoscyphus albidus]|uniref:Uncharacterized protein n=1 Tax=Hymenoscyphus albidus TaxID=595503 RepID=A0A9N9LVQ8_9HELO|nr:hypothetical protein HYALB_00013975 [Hymenoscyphus albidus]
MSAKPDPKLPVKESKFIRAIWALPLLLNTYGASQTMGVLVQDLAPALLAQVKAATIDFGDGTETVGLVKKFFGVAGLDGFLSVLVTFFTPLLDGGHDRLGSLQATAFLGDLIPLQAIMYVEGVRRGNRMTATSLLPTLFGIAYQAKGVGYVLPIYFFLHHIQLPLENYQKPEDRLTRVSAVKTIIPTLALTFILPTYIMLSTPGLANRQWINGLFWQLFPLYGAICQQVLGLFVKDTTEKDRVSNPEADMPYLRLTYGFTAIIAAALNLYVRLASPFPLKDVFFNDISSPSAAATLITGTARFLRYDQIFSFGAGILWILLSFKDLKKAGKTQAGWVKIIGAFAGATLAFGPGSAMVGMWAWREEILVNRKSALKKQ